MPFPEAPKVIYDKNPLDLVICQLRFPPILKIDAEIPADFQDLVRRQFPNFNETAEVAIEIPPGQSAQIPVDVLRQMLPSNKNYEFSSEDEVWKINLTRTFVALSTKGYPRWSEFKKKLEIPFEALCKVYSPNYFSRVGLRYIDVIRRSKLELTDIDLKELLSPYISGPLNSADVGPFVKNFESKYEINLVDGLGIARIIAKFVEFKEENNEICFMIDSDFSRKEKINIASALELLDSFNLKAHRLFRWCITDKLHKAMGPKNYEP
jgi:uncharacterized protein (TIGR04255 family)